jgi:hypothetical protein
VGPQPGELLNATEVAAGGVFQLGLLAALLVVRRTGAAGRGRGSRFVTATAVTLVAVALVWTFGSVLALAVADDPSNLAEVPGAMILVVLDPSWPLSMVWLLVVGVAVFRARVWPMPVRALPLAASFVLPVHIIAEVLGLTTWQSWALPVLYVAVAYFALGIGMAVQLPGRAERGAQVDGSLEPASP